MANRLTVTSVDVAKNRLTVCFSCKGKMRNFFTSNKFTVEYNTSIENVPEAILVIPFLASACPIAWANQADVFVDTVDETFLRSLDRVQKTLQKFYPQMKFSGKVYAKKIVTPDIGIQANSMMLFSGGIDALATYVRHQAENPILVSVHGAVIDFNDKEAWNRFIGHMEKSFDKTRVTLRTISSNFIKIVDMFLLSEYHPKISGTWQNKVMHGLALIGLCAPLAFVDKVGKLYIAATFTDSVKMPHGSHPEIDNHVRWTGIKVIHDGHELGRQEKIDFLADFLKNKNPEHYIHVCLTSKTDKNCSKCEKCSRTILGLELAGINPDKHGFVVNSDTFIRIKKNLANGLWKFGDEESMWVELQERASSYSDLPHPQAQVVIDWLPTVDVYTLLAPSPKSSRLIPFFKYLPPPIYRLTKRTYIALNGCLCRKK